MVWVLKTISRVKHVLLINWRQWVRWRLLWFRSNHRADGMSGWDSSCTLQVVWVPFSTEVHLIIHWLTGSNAQLKSCESTAVRKRPQTIIHASVDKHKRYPFFLVVKYMCLLKNDCTGGTGRNSDCRWSCPGYGRQKESTPYLRQWHAGEETL